MNRLFWGLLFCLLDYEITLGTAVIGLLPDFAGYFLMMKGLEELAFENRSFDKARHICFGLAIASVVFYVVRLMDPGYMTQVIFWAAELVALVVQLVMLRMIVSGVLWVEHDHDLQLGGSVLKSLWKILIVICPLCHVFRWIPLIGAICAMAGTVVGALFLAAFWTCKKEYRRSR